MTAPSVLIGLFVGVLLLAQSPALWAADGRAPGFQTQARQTAQKRLRWHDTRRKPAASRTHSQEAQISAPRHVFADQNDRAENLLTSLNVQDIIIDSYPGAPYTTVRTFDGTRITIQFLSRTSSPVVRPALQPAGRTPPPPANVPFISLLEEPPVLAQAPAALPSLPAPTFASSVPGKPGCVYPPGAPRIPANIVDVTGLRPGTRARDPLTNVIFLVPFIGAPR